MKVFYHHVYEFKKGLRNLVLCAEKREHRERIEERLRRDGIAHVVHPLGEDRINVFFGQEACIRVVQSWRVERLSQLTDEQDFILGVMLGYDRLQQCDRYLERRSRRARRIGDAAHPSAARERAQVARAP